MQMASTVEVASDSVHRPCACSLVANRDEIPQVQFLDTCSSAAGEQHIDKVVDVPVVSQRCSARRLRRLLTEAIQFLRARAVVTEILESFLRAVSGSHFPQCSCSQYKEAFGRISVFPREGGHQS